MTHSIGRGPGAGTRRLLRPGDAVEIAWEVEDVVSARHQEHTMPTERADEEVSNRTLSLGALPKLAFR